MKRPRWEKMENLTKNLQNGVKERAFDGFSRFFMNRPEKVRF